MFQITAQSVEEIQSYWYASTGYHNGVLMVVRVNDINVPKYIKPVIWWLLSYPSPTLFYITHHFQPYEPHLRNLALEIKRRAEEWEFTCGFQEKRGFCPSFQDFSSHWSLWSEENFSMYENLNFSLVSQTQSIISINFKLFLSLNSMRHTLSSRIAKTYFSQISWNTS